jgi:hypothetical protein
MRIEFLQEPELEFGVNRHVDIRFGLMNFGPVDYENSLAPKQIRLGIVGTNETVEGVRKWLERCRREIPGKESGQPNLFPKFPGFREDVGFLSTLVMDDRLQRTINTKLFADTTLKGGIKNIINKAADLFYSELSYLSENVGVDVLMCAIPQSLLDTMESTRGIHRREPDDNDEEGAVSLNLHHLLKAKAMDLKVPIQLIIPSTYDESKRRLRKRDNVLMRRTQDEATRAWNLHTALYYKAKGVPWRLTRKSTDLATCCIGISFYKTLEGSSLMTSVAQVFNERGEGVVVRGGPAKIAKDDRHVYLDEEDANTLLNDALSLYREEHKNLPARVVLHKTSAFNKTEIDGFQKSTQAHNIELVDMVSISKTFTRLYRTGAYPPLRGTFLRSEDGLNVLYTRGSVDFFATYPGMYVPRPLLFRCDLTEQTPEFLAREILALTKMNWNNTQFDRGEPITIRAARQVGEILKYVPPDGEIARSYRFYM